MPNTTARLPIILALAGLLAACGSTLSSERDFPGENTEDQSAPQEMFKKIRGDETLFGDLAFGGPPKPSEGESVLRVNYFLWRGALETLAMGPLESADPYGGVVVTEWFNVEDNPYIQYRVTAYIMSRELRADALKIALYIRETRDGKTVTRRASREAETQLENTILAKARAIRVAEFR